MGSYCVYKHTCPNGKIYIGMTQQKPETRWANGLGYATQVFGKAVKKYGWKNIKHEVILDGLTKEQAEEIEKKLIKEHGTRDLSNGYNMADGGSGSYGHTVSAETRRKMSEASNKKWADKEVREKLLNHLRELNRSRVGKKLDPEMVKRRAKALEIKVDQYDKDGKFIQTFDSLMDAARSLGKETNSAIVSCCKGKKKSYCGFIWKYHGDELTKEELERINRSDLPKKPIVMCDDEWNEIKRFPGFHDAGRELGINYRSIFSAVKTGRHCNGYKWRYAI